MAPSGGIENYQKQLQQRVIRAAEAALTDHQCVSLVDALTGIGFLAPSHVDAWRKGRIEFLDSMIQGNQSKISFAISTFRDWVRASGLDPSESAYVRNAPSGSVELKFSITGDPGVEKMCRTHYISPAASGRKRKQIAEKLAKAPPPVVFMILRDSQCSEMRRRDHGRRFSPHGSAATPVSAVRASGQLGISAVR